MPKLLLVASVAEQAAIRAELNASNVRARAIRPSAGVWRVSFSSLDDPIVEYVDSSVLQVARMLWDSLKADQRYVIHSTRP